MIVMRLLSSLNHDESERGIYQLGRELVKRGHTSIVVSSNTEDYDLVKRLQRDGNIYHKLPMHKKSWWGLLQVLNLRKCIEKYNPDVIHIHSRTPAWLLHWALKRARLKKKPKVVATMYNFYPNNAYSHALLKSDVIITVSDSVTRYLLSTIEQAKSYHGNIVRIYRGVDTRRYLYRHNPSVFWLRETFTEFPELEHKKWLLFPTIVGKDYGQEWLLDILGNLQNNFPTIHAVILDDDKNSADIFYEEFRQRAFALNLDGKITFVGSNRNDTREWLAATNLVLALANEPESIGIPILQSLHLGTPVVSWDSAAYSEILRCLYPQGLVKKHNAVTVCKVVKNQLENPSHPMISNNFTLKQTVNETLQLYTLLCNKEEIPDCFSKLDT